MDIEFEKAVGERVVRLRDAFQWEPESGDLQGWCDGWGIDIQRDGSWQVDEYFYETGGWFPTSDVPFACGKAEDTDAAKVTALKQIAEVEEWRLRQELAWEEANPRGCESCGYPEGACHPESPENGSAYVPPDGRDGR